MNGRPARWLLLALVVVQLVVISRQAGQADPTAPLAERAAVRAIGPLAGASEAVARGARGTRETLRTRRQLADENVALRERVAELERETLRRRALEHDFQRLAEAMRYSGETHHEIRVADVVYADHASWLRSLLVAVGPEGAARNQPVVVSEGVVGRVVVPGRPYAKVQLITDRASAVGAMIERTRRQGVVKGSGDGGLLLDYLPLQADVRVGDRVITAGIDGIYPRGLPIGVVRSVEPGTQLFHRIEVSPVVDFGLLDHVYLLSAIDIDPELRAPGLRGGDSTETAPADEDRS
jgi:rod shape-determining protein MreC